MISGTIPNMPRRHGISLEQNQAVGLFGVWDLFEILARPPFRTTPLGTSHEPTNLAFHFRRALELLFYCLDGFQMKHTAFDKFLEEGGIAGPNAGAFYEIQTEANVFAQAVLSNLNIVLDDIARIIPFVLFALPTESQKPKQGFLQLKKHRLPKYPSTSILPQLKALFDELDDKSSWLERSIGYGIGMRQRLSHYTDLIILSGSAPPGEARMRSNFELVSIGTSEYKVDFPTSLKTLLQDLCDWLDRLDALLVEHLCNRAKREGIEWQPPKKCPGYLLPIVRSATVREIPKVDYLYLPLCVPPHGVQSDSSML